MLVLPQTFCYPKSMKKLWIAIVSSLLHACYELPQGVQTVQNFDVQRYLGTWYEIARLDHSFERGLNQVSATYTALPDGSLQVLNRGYDTQAKKWKSAQGVAQFVGSSTQGHLRVSFFRPFYGSYGIFALDSAYSYAFVSGGSTNYLWLLSRTREVSPELKEMFLQRAGELGFPTSQIIWVNQNAMN
jgi:apolipoprotein D and lipocalin family protein